MGRRKGAKNKTKPNEESETKRDTKKQSWMLTINNPTGDELDPISTAKKAEWGSYIKYVKYALEEGEANHTPHIHIVLFLSEQVRFSAIKNVFPRARIEAELKGSNGQLIDYVGNPDFIYSDKHPDISKRGKKKGGICVVKNEYGSLAGIRLTAKAEGSTLDSRLNAMQEAILAGKSTPELYELDFPVMVRYGNQLEQYRTVLAGAKKEDAVSLRIMERRKEMEDEHRMLVTFMEAQETTRVAINKEIEEDLRQLDAM
jgi:hypothetical protein